MPEERHPDPLAAAAAIIDEDSPLVRMALTHRSYMRETGKEVPSYERLEFLGDSVVNLAVVTELYRRYPGSDEGELSFMRNGIVCGDCLAEAAERLDLGAKLLIGPGAEGQGVRHSRAVLADVFEAVTGAVYLERGFVPATRLVLLLLEDAIAAAAGKDAKTELQELAVAREMGVPHYVQLERSGPDHEPSFTMAVELRGERLGSGRGRSKKDAEMQAAKEALEKLR